MSEHSSLYRKYRSQSFDDLVGQDHVVKTLTNAVKAGTVAHAYLFTGPRGTGKTSTARLLAKAVNHVDDPESDLAKQIASGNCMDVVEMDAASESGVEDVRRSIVEASNYQPTQLKYKVYIIDEVHDLSGKAFDALLKTIEEPPAHVIFVLATTEYHKVPPTIRSRCQRFTFHRAKISDLVSRLAYVTEKEGREAEDAALSVLARMADGSFRDALTLLEQVLLTSEGKVTVAHVYDQLGLIDDESIDSLASAIAEGDGESVLKILENFSNLGRDPRAVLDSMTYRLADLTRAAYGVPTQSGLDASQETALKSTAQRISLGKLIEMRSKIAELGTQLRDSSLPKLFLESSLLGMANALSQESLQPTVPKRQSAKREPVAAAATSEAGSNGSSVAEASDNPAEGSQEAEQSSEPAEEVDPEFERAQKAWKKIVAELSTQSKVFADRFSGSSTRVVCVEDGVAQVEISKMNLDWLQGSDKRMPIVMDAWKSSADGLRLEFVGLNEKKKRRIDVEVSRVDAVLSGELLVEKIRKQFKLDG